MLNYLYNKVLCSRRERKKIINYYVDRFREWHTDLGTPVDADLFIV